MRFADDFEAAMLAALPEPPRDETAARVRACAAQIAELFDGDAEVDDERVIRMMAEAMA
jgi:hypothetical protein